MIRIFLTGYMGAGKTTLGKAFARELNVPFIDLDWYIEERFHKSIRELFVERGEASFRELERNMLHEVSEFEDVIISTGGGTPCFFDNMDYMNGHGQTVFLDVHLDILFNRLRVATHQRPILQGKTDEELSVVCVEEKVYKSAYAVDKGWKALRIKEVLDFSLVGILYKISKILAENNIGIFAVSTYNTDYILVKEENINKATEKLDENGYKISKL